ncbi:sugar phosphate isomerase/epimerase [Paenibacillus athensensis]|uniref:Xylose isomerase n=1 Tax=Paenibacillus athensensis TaxID=1967502 RepID=A0A4Y8PYL1_9BACL|nr:sugar phosphate isomerase/epimerase family protein [Paenibacillus athensensis]MCD1261247.1 sugar phosphate isomerase/epimerase [Paenibacillus athensensis]
MIKGISRAGIGEAGSLERLVVEAAKAGFAAVDAGGDELQRWLEEAGLEAAQAHLQRHGIQLGAIGLPVEWRADEDTFRSGLKDLALHAEAAAQFGVTACCTYVLPATDYPAAHFMALATRRLRTCAQILGAYGIRLGLEFVGPHHLRSAWANPFIWTMQETLDWIDAIGEPNVGLLLDAYHWYTTGGTEAELLQLSPQQIVHVHLNDAKPVPVNEVLDNDRLYPSEGVIDLGTFLKALQTIGYRGVVAQEILTLEPPAGSSEQLLARSAAGYRKAYAAAGLK